MHSIEHMAELSLVCKSLKKDFKASPGKIIDIIYLRGKGHNNTEVANKLGLARQTIQRYCEVLRNVDVETYNKVFESVAKIFLDTK